MEESMEQTLKIRNIISITVLNLIQIQNIDLSEHFWIDYPNLKDFRLFTLQYTRKKVIKMFILVTSFSLVRIRTNRKNFDWNFKIWIKYQKNNINQTRNLIYLTFESILYVSYVRGNQKKVDLLGSFINIVWFWSRKYFKICEYFILIGYYHKYYLWRTPWYL